MSRWYRAYEGTVTDPKFGEASLIAECSRAVAIAAWHAILENAAAINDGGRYDTTARRIAVILCEPPALITSVLDAFSELGLITAGTVAAWGRRQYESDTSTERSRRSRAKKRECNDAATLHGRRATPPETDTDSEEPEATASGPAAPVETGAAPAIDFCKAVFDSGRAILTRSGLDARKAGSLIGRWRQSLGDAEILTLIRQAEADAVSDPAAWLAAAVETRNGKSRPHRGQSDRPVDGFTSALRRASAKFEAAEYG